MKLQRNSRLRPATMLLAALAIGVTACDSDKTPLTPKETGALTMTAGMEVSSASVAPGGRVAVAIAVDPGTARPLGGLQGYIDFDASRLRYVGQAANGNTITLVNDQEAARGELRVASLDDAGLDERVGTFVFEVLGPGYTEGLTYRLESAVLNKPIEELDVSKATIAPRAVVAAGLAVPAEFSRLTVADWAERLGARVGPAGPRVAEGISLRPGEIRNGLRFGDANLDGTISLADALYILNSAVGLSQIIVGTDSGTASSRDAVVAGNPFPFNTPGLGEPGDPLPPGQQSASDPTRVINVADGLAILNEAVGNDQPIVGQLIPGRAPPPSSRIAVTANITSNTTWTNDNVYELQGGIRVTNGATLTIQPGTRIEGRRGTAPGVEGAALFVQRDGRIIADGTFLQPIIMTCTGGSKFKGCWGGLVINGNATLNDGTATSPAIEGRASAGCLEKNGEGDSGRYGGCNPDDNSGILRYVRVEYAGFRFTPENELNGIALQGVGRGTTVNYIQVHAGLDDGLEFFGGTVNVKHVLLTANSDDGFDWTEGWDGKAQFVIVQQDSLDADKGIEADNAPAAFDATPRATPDLYNFTLVGKANPASTSGTAGNNVVGGIHIRRGTRPTLRNFIVQNFPFALDIDDPQTCVNINAEFSFRTSLFAANAALNDADADPACGPYSGSNVEAQFIQDPANGNSVVASSPLISPLNVRVPDFRPQFGTAGSGSTPPSDGFFEPAAYRGAVAPANSSRSNVPWYSGWTRGWQTPTAP